MPPVTKDFACTLASQPFPDNTLPNTLGRLDITTSEEPNLQGILTFVPGRWRGGQGIPRADLGLELQGTTTRFGQASSWILRLSFTVGEDRDGIICGWTPSNKEVRCQIISNVFSGTPSPSKDILEDAAADLAKRLGTWLGKNHPDLWKNATTLWCLHEAYALKTQIDKTWNQNIVKMMTDDQKEWHLRSVKTITKPFMASLLMHPDKNIRLWLTQVWQEQSQQIAAQREEDAIEEAEALARRAARKR